MASRTKQRSSPPLRDQPPYTRQQIDELRAQDHAKVDAYYDLVLRQAGMADRSALRAVQPLKSPAPATGTASRDAVQLSEEIDLHPFTRVEDARITLEYYLMLASQRGLPRVRVIHGIGEGVLRRMVRTVLAQSPLVESIDDGPWLAGGDGITAANLKRQRPPART
jgi:DNA-nicking Smr family endonuclease